MSNLQFVQHTWITTVEIMSAVNEFGGRGDYALCSSRGLSNHLDEDSRRVGFDKPGRRQYILSNHRAESTFLAAAKVGGIFAIDTYSGDIIRDILLIQTNSFEGA